ncbi:MAG: DUF1097 domain-containing protein [Pseudoxanthomonas sp.]|jgi:hypothetical protein
MKPLIALAVSIAVLVALWVYLSIGLPSLQLIPWIGFVAWATFFAAGGGRTAITQALPPAIAGVLLTALTMFGVGHAGGGLSALIVLVAVLAFVLVAMAGHKALAYTPAAFLGAASYFGSGGKVDESILFVAASWIVGMAFGYVSERFGARLTRAA